jgi:tripartite-type tricarboxylate transporter receptor subunit TctC
MLSRRVVAAGLVLAASVFGPAAMAQTPAWPTHPVRIIVGYPPGSILDVLARLFATRLSPRWGQPVVVENRIGASGTIGADTVAKSTDGHTLLWAASPELVIAPHTLRSIPYDPVRDFAPIMLVTEFPFVLAAHPSVPANSLAELIALGKARPDYLSYGSIGIGSASHMTGALFGARAGITLNHVPYRGSAPMMTDLLAGHIPITFDTVSAVLPNLKDGRLKAFAIATAQRTDLAPNIPTFAELGMPDFVSSGWGGLLAPAATPPAVIQKIWKDCDEIMRSEAAAIIRDRGAVPRGTTPEEYKAFLAREVPKWAAMAKQAGVQPE